MVFMETQTKKDEDKLAFFASGLSDEGLKRALSEYVVSVACRRFGDYKKEDVIAGKSHKRGHVFIRYAAYNILYIEIGKIIDLDVRFTERYLSDFFNKRSHTSCFHAVKTHAQLMDTNYSGYVPMYEATFKEISDSLTDSLLNKNLFSKLEFIEASIASLTKSRDEIIAKINKIKNENDGKES
jgi:hypothetical protein